MSKMNRREEQGDLAEQLRQAIKDAGLSAYAAARDSGVDRSQMVRFINGDRDLTLGTASKVATMLGLELRPIRRKGR